MAGVGGSEENGGVNGSNAKNWGSDLARDTCRLAKLASKQLHVYPFLACFKMLSVLKVSLTDNLKLSVLQIGLPSPC